MFAKFKQQTGEITVVDWQPGNGTRYEIVLAEIGFAREILGCGDNAYLLSIPNLRGRPMMMINRHLPVVDYVMEKTGLNEVDAQAVLDGVRTIFDQT